MGLMKIKTGLWILVFMAYVLPFTIHAVSFFSPNWLVEGGMNKGLFYQCPVLRENYKGCSLNMLDRATIGIEGTCLVLMLFSLCNTVLSLVFYGPDSWDDFDNDDKEGCFRTFNGLTFYCCSIACYPIIGILILSGCIRFGSLFPTEILGVSFYFCTIAGCLQFVMGEWVHLGAGILILSGCIRFGSLFPTEILGVSFYFCTIAGCLQFVMISIAYFLPFILLAISFFTPRWFVEGGAIKGLFYQCLQGKTCELHILDQPTIGLEGTSLVLGLFGCCYSVLSACLYGPDEDDFIFNSESDEICFTCNCLSFYCCAIGMYPVNGILILCGCIKFGTQFHTETLGVSFYLCAIAGCLYFIMMFISCCDACCKKKEDDFVFKTLMQDIYEDAA